MKLQNKIDDGQIILVNSMSGHRVVWKAQGHFYCASKHAVTGLLEGFRQEVFNIAETTFSISFNM